MESRAGLGVVGDCRPPRGRSGPNLEVPTLAGAQRKPFQDARELCAFTLARDAPKGLRARPPAGGLGRQMSEARTTLQIDQHVAVVEALGQLHRALPVATVVVGADREAAFGVDEP